MSTLSFVRDNAPYLGAGALLAFTSSFGQTYFISVFAGEIRETFVLSHGQWGGIYATATTISAIVMVWSGVLTDRMRVRALAPIVLVGLALACLGMAGVASVWMLGAVIFALRLTGQGMTSHISMVAMARWFVARRGRALSIAALGFACGEAFLPMIFVALKSIFDWRLLWGLAAVFVLAVIFPLTRLLKFERTPQSISAETVAVGMDGRQWKRMEVIRHWLFWLVLPSVLGPSAFITAFFFLQVHVAEVKGYSHVSLAALFPVYTGAGIAAMLAAGWAIDRVGAARLMPIFQIPMIAGFLVLSWGNGLGAAALSLGLLGISTGMNATLSSAFWAEFYGTQHIGAIKSLGTAAMVLGSAIGPGITGLMIDAGVDFPQQGTAIAAYFACACLAAGFGVARAGPSLAAAT
ncbi:MAG: MFS transporter [Pseudomonadota bacterium]